MPLWITHWSYGLLVATLRTRVRASGIRLQSESVAHTDHAVDTTFIQ